MTPRQRQHLLSLVEAATHQFKGSHFGDEHGTTFSVEAVVNFAKKDPSYFHKSFPVSKVLSQLSWWEKDKSQTAAHMRTVDTSFPILVIREADGSLSVADGLNRLKKATSIENKESLPAYVVPKKDIEHLGE